MCTQRAHDELATWRRRHLECSAVVGDDDNPIGCLKIHTAPYGIRHEKQAQKLGQDSSSAITGPHELLSIGFDGSNVARDTSPIDATIILAPTIISGLGMHIYIAATWRERDLNDLAQCKAELEYSITVAAPETSAYIRKLDSWTLHHKD